MRRLLLIIANLYLFLSTAIICIVHVDDLTGHGQQTVDGSQDLMFFTVDSNLLMAVSAGILLVCLLICRKRRPGWLDMLELMATVSVGVTFFTVALFLGFLPEYLGFAGVQTGWMYAALALVSLALLLPCLKRKQT